MKVNILFKTTLKEKFGESRIIDIDGETVKLEELLFQIENEDWGAELIENGHIRSPIMLIIDDKLVQNDIEMEINENSNITFYVMFAGG